MSATYGPTLCSLVEQRPAGGANTMEWWCSKCRLAWIAAALDPDVMPVNPRRQVDLARAAARRYDDPRLALAADVLAARITESEER